MHSFTIPRAVSVIAGGVYSGELAADGSVVIEVSAALDDPDWQIIQSPFMQQNAVTRNFRQRLKVSAQELKYSQTTLVDIYHYESFEHSDENRLQRC